ncbi:LacI family transcriptional regulator [Palleronia aestuarii]|uniref:LacI family transcriptional regulator n=1 Tax=Palleronia aestuarii TaxID=568105 RepID=A0A2W7N986_9RHOB|nr:LacI family DNA-binding transcriptional regulator [Palleronia aestuarii]PZX16965.1 LacI family transcriptional regulator [Palleronia aestuarii]
MMSDESPARPLTSRELAALIGVSQSAVSRAFTPGSSISSKLRARILGAAHEYGYQPNAIASMMTTKRTKIVGIVVSDMRNPFYPALIERLTQALQRVGFQSLLFNISPGARIEEQLVAIRTYNVDTVIVISATILDDRTLNWAAGGRRAILLNRLSHQDMPTVCCDNVAGARAVVDHFHAIDRHRIGYVAGLAKTAVGMTRQGAFTTRLAELGMRLVGSAGSEAYTFEAGWQGALDLLAARPDAIFFASDILALGGLGALRAAGVRIPEDIAVAGFDDIVMAGWPTNDLTTYRQPVDQLIEKAIEMTLAAEIDEDRLVLLPGELIIRGSTSGD